jgi:hypothetical protein
LAEAYDKNQDNLSSAKDLDQVSVAFDNIISKGGTVKDAVAAANAELVDMGVNAV